MSTTLKVLGELEQGGWNVGCYDHLYSIKVRLYKEAEYRTVVCTGLWWAGCAWRCRELCAGDHDEHGMPGRSSLPVESAPWSAEKLDMPWLGGCRCRNSQKTCPIRLEFLAQHSSSKNCQMCSHSAYNRNGWLCPRKGRPLTSEANDVEKFAKCVQTICESQIWFY